VRIQARAAVSGLLGAVTNAFSGAFTSPASTGPSLDAGGGSWLGDTSGLRLDGMRAGGGEVLPFKRYLVGERGPELLQMGASGGSVVPNGALGGGVMVNVINNGTPQQVMEQHESIDSRGQRRIDLVLSDMVASEMRRSGSSMNSAVRSTFGAQPVLARR
jgi:hypothetical protein